MLWAYKEACMLHVADGESLGKAMILGQSKTGSQNLNRPGLLNQGRKKAKCMNLEMSTSVGLTREAKDFRHWGTGLDPNCVLPMGTLENWRRLDRRTKHIGNPEMQEITRHWLRNHWKENANAPRKMLKIPGKAENDCNKSRENQVHQNSWRHWFPYYFPHNSTNGPLQASLGMSLGSHFSPENGKMLISQFVFAHSVQG